MTYYKFGKGILAINGEDYWCIFDLNGQYRNMLIGRFSTLGLTPITIQEVNTRKLEQL